MYDFRFPDADRFTSWFLISQTWNAMFRVAEKELAKTGLTPEKARVLWLCADYPPPLTPAELSRFVFRKSHSTAGLLDRMETEGLISRVPKKKGHPFTEIQLTEKGRELVGPAKEATIRLISELMSPLTAEEVEQLQEPLRKLREHALARLHVDRRPWSGNGWGPAPTVDCKAL